MRSGYETVTISQFFQSDSIPFVFQMSCGGWFNQTSTWAEILKFAINQIFPKKNIIRTLFYNISKNQISI